MAKVIKILLIIIGLAIIGSAVYVFSPRMLKLCCLKTTLPNGPAGWKTYTNEKYTYSFKYPAGSSVDLSGLNTGPEPITQTSLPLSVSNPRSARDALFNIETDPPVLLSGTLNYQIFLGLGLDELAKMIWGANKTQSKNFPSKKISDLTPVNIGGSSGYQFTQDSEFSLGGSGYVLESERKYILLENGGRKFMISLPTGEPDAEKILKSFVFIK